MTPTLKVKRLHPDAIIPKYQTAGAAAFDLHAVEGGTVLPGSQHIFRTGLAFEVPDDHVMLVFSRSGHGFKQQLRLSNCVGVIDADYRGELFVSMHNDSPSGYPLFERGSRIAQALVLPVQQWQLVEVDELTETERAANGGGSTGN